MIQRNTSIKLVDFDKWYKKGWTSGLAKSIVAEYGVTPIRILRNDENPDHVILVSIAPTIEAFDNARSDPRIIELINDPETTAEPPEHLGFYTTTDLPNNDGPDLFGFHIEHKLVDYDNWFKIFSKGPMRQELEKKYGVRAIRVLRSIGIPNEAQVVFTGPSQQAMDDMNNDERVQARFNDQSIFICPPKITGRYTVVII